MTKKESYKGIEIPTECGSAEMYELLAILFTDENATTTEKKYNVYVTREDFTEGKLFTTIGANMNPELLLYPDVEHEGMGCLQYDLVEAEYVELDANEIPSLVVSDIVGWSDTTWIESGVGRDKYLTIVPKTLSMVDNVISVEE